MTSCTLTFNYTCVYWVVFTAAANSDCALGSHRVRRIRAECAVRAPSVPCAPGTPSARRARAVRAECAKYTPSAPSTRRVRRAHRVLAEYAPSMPSARRVRRVRRARSECTCLVARAERPARADCALARTERTQYAPCAQPAHTPNTTPQTRTTPYLSNAQRKHQRSATRSAAQSHVCGSGLPPNLSQASKLGFLLVRFVSSQAFCKKLVICFNFLTGCLCHSSSERTLLPPFRTKSISTPVSFNMAPKAKIGNM